MGRQKKTMQPLSERIQKSTSVVEVVPIRGAMSHVPEMSSNVQNKQLRSSPLTNGNENHVYRNATKEQSPLVQSSKKISDVPINNVESSGKDANVNSREAQMFDDVRTKDEQNNKDNLIIPLSPPDSEDQTA